MQIFPFTSVPFPVRACVRLYARVCHGLLIHLELSLLISFLFFLFLLPNLTFFFFFLAHPFPSSDAQLVEVFK